MAMALGAVRTKPKAPTADTREDETVGGQVINAVAIIA
jgi:hypothetical protein